MVTATKYSELSKRTTVTSRSAWIETSLAVPASSISAAFMICVRMTLYSMPTLSTSTLASSLM